MTDNSIAGWHLGRSWGQERTLEKSCPCKKAPCGLAIEGTAGDCPEHVLMRGKTIRQAHAPQGCPEPPAVDQPGTSPARGDDIPDLAAALAQSLSDARREIAARLCPGTHEPRQHRDRKRPWCRLCGRDQHGVLIGKAREDT